MITGINLDNINAVRNRLNNLTLSQQKRRAILNEISKDIIKATKTRVRAQQAVDGTAWEKRKKGKRKMLQKIGQRIKPVVLNENEAVISWQGRTAKIAGKHQTGFTEIKNVRDLQRQSGRQGINTTSPATRQQARALLAVGYKVKKNAGAPYSTPSIRWITSHLTVSRASAILRVMRGNSRTSWRVVIPSRPIAGITEQNITHATQIIREKLS